MISRSLNFAAFPSKIAVKAGLTRMDGSKDNIWKQWFTEFYQKDARSLWFYILKVCRDENLADDIFQDTFYKFLQAKPAVLNEGHMRSYLFKIASNLIIDRIRREKVARNAWEEQQRDYMDEMYKQDQEAETLSFMGLDRMFRLMNTKERILLWLTYVEGHTCGEVAEIMGSKESSVKVQLFRARKKLAGFLKHDKRAGEKRR
jgi:RNA polymerase sigma-70 factor (ECF subfamily)